MISSGLLLDTHTFLWMSSFPERLGPKCVRTLQAGNTDIFFSTVSAWEITVKHSLSKLQLPEEPGEFIEKQIAALNLFVLPIGLSHAFTVGKLKNLHRDPFDRLLIAQATCERLTILTNDSVIPKYRVSTIDPLV